MTNAVHWVVAEIVLWFEPLLWCFIWIVLILKDTFIAVSILRGTLLCSHKLFYRTLQSLWTLGCLGTNITKIDSPGLVLLLPADDSPFMSIMSQICRQLARRLMDERWEIESWESDTEGRCCGSHPDRNAEDTLHHSGSLSLSLCPCLFHWERVSGKGWEEQRK